MAETKQCKECMGMFQYTTSDGLCLTCSQRNELEFKKIKNYLKLNPRATIGKIATDLDIKVAHIQKFVDEGRLEIIDKQ
ncbi:hypothetical protein [Ruminiclostridium cellobioparum]|jgi:hypothetical protein|uniref:MerR family transcriptional regulator n=1 Tax=Ruminiclostridium cellobioparum subsp. termitidis CT1112 TaxID=1195236 RepID=S0FLP1_RUMCE|nr:hypothetical protein [Ruminiclostridium cellobioparum]EMS70084.1 hypothetical protein CTER_4276 [Ruminiclostridium cellobioparum subsp. termitidis CT1112]